MKNIFIFFSFITTIALSQNYNQKIDSLKKELGKDNTPKENSTLHKLISLEFNKTKKNIDSAYYYASKGYDISVEEELYEDQVGFLFELAVINYSIGSYDKSLAFYNLSLSIAEKIGYNKYIPAVTNNIGDIYLIKKDYVKANELFNKSLLYAKKTSNPKLEALEYINIGEVYYYTNDINKSLEYISKGLNKYDSLGVHPASGYYNLSRTLVALNKFDLAEKNSIIGINNAIEDNKTKFIYKQSLLLSEIYTKTNRYEEALVYSKKALKYKDSLDKKNEFNNLEKFVLNFKIKEQTTILNNKKKKNRYLKTIYILIFGGVILLLVLIFRQLKIVKMTKAIHQIQHSLLKHEFDKRNKANNTNFEVTVNEDTDFLKD